MAELAPSLERTKAAVVRVLEQEARLAPKRREQAASITIVRLPEESEVEWHPDSASFLAALRSQERRDRPPAAVIPRHEFEAVALGGGLRTYLQRALGPGRYRARWNSADSHTIDAEVVEIPDLERLARERQVEADRRRAETVRRQRAARAESARARQRADEAALLGAWVRTVSFDFLTEVGRTAPLGLETPRLQAAIEHWLRTNARWFVGVARGDFVPALAPVRGPSGPVVMPTMRWDPRRPRLDPLTTRDALMKTLAVFSPPRRSRES